MTSIDEFDRRYFSRAMFALGLILGIIVGLFTERLFFSPKRIEKTTSHSHVIGDYTYMFPDDQGLIHVEGGTYQARPDCYMVMGEKGKDGAGDGGNAIGCGPGVYVLPGKAGRGVNGQ